MQSVPVAEAFSAGLAGAPFGPIDPGTVVVHLVTQPPGENLLYFERISRWPPLELTSDSENAYRVGRAFRAGGHYLDELGVPLDVGKDVLNQVIRMGNLHTKMHGGRHSFGPSHVIEPIVKALSPIAAHPSYLQQKGITEDHLRDAMWRYVRANAREFEPFSRN